MKRTSDTCIDTIIGLSDVYNANQWQREVARIKRVEKGRGVDGKFSGESFPVGSVSSRRRRGDVKEC